MLINVLSLFDGISCGAVALERAGIPVDNYYASEIDKFATSVSNYNYPNIYRLGGVLNWRNWIKCLPKIDLLLAGFPCQSWSCIGKQKGIRDKRGQLVFTLIDILNELKKSNENFRYLFETTNTKKSDRAFLDYILGTSFKTNSKVFTPCSRNRLYWFNWSVSQPENKSISVREFINNSEYIAGTVGNSDNRVFRQTEVLGALTKSYHSGLCGSGRPMLIKPHCIGKKMSEMVKGEDYKKLTVAECERLQVNPEGYTKVVSDCQKYKALGNGWQVDTIAHILKGSGLCS